MPRQSEMFSLLQMSIDRRLVNQKWLGDSHLKPQHGVPRAYQDITIEMKEHSIRYRGPLDLTKPWLQGGQLISKKWACGVADLIQKNDGTPSCYVLCIGTNNLRERCNEKEVKNIKDWHNIIIEATLRTNNAALLIVSPIPDQRHDTHILAEKLDSELDALCKEKGKDSGKVKYVRFRSKKCPHDNRPTRWNPVSFRGIHLSPTGARDLAREIFNAQVQIPNEVYGMPKDEVSLEKRVSADFPGWDLRRFDREMGALLRRGRGANLPPSGAHPN